MGYFVTNKIFFVRDIINLKKIIEEHWNFDHLFLNEINRKKLMNFMFKHFHKNANKRIYVYKDFKLVATALIAVPTKKLFKKQSDYERLLKDFRLNQNFSDNELCHLYTYLFNIKELFEWKVLNNGQSSGFIIGVYIEKGIENSESLQNFLVGEINRIFAKYKMKSVHFADLDFSFAWLIKKTNAKMIYEIDIKYDLFLVNPEFASKKSKLNWYLYFLGKNKESEIETNLNVYGLYLEPWSLYCKSYKSYNPDADTTFLLIHGLAATHETFNVVIDFLRQYGHVDLIDLPLHGKSNVFPLNAVSWDLSAMGLYVSSFIRAKNYQKLVIWGHSLGGGVALVAWFNCHDVVKGLILEDTYNPGALKNKTNFLKGIMQAANNHVKWIKWKKENPNLFFENSESSKETHSVIDVYKPITKKTIFFINNLLNQHLRFFIDWIYTNNTTLDTLVMFGENDFIINADLSKEYFQKLSPNYEYHTIPYANHSSHQNNPNVVIADVKKYLEEKLKLLPFKKPDSYQEN